MPWTMLAESISRQNLAFRMKTFLLFPDPGLVRFLWLDKGPAHCKDLRPRLAASGAVSSGTAARGKARPFEEMSLRPSLDLRGCQIRIVCQHSLLLKPQLVSKRWYLAIICIL